MRFNSKWFLTAVVAASLCGLPGFAQDPGSGGPQQSSGWKRFQANGPADRGGDFDPDPGPGSAPAQPPRQAQPSSITIPAGTWITVRVNEPLSSDHNQAGDAFAGTLVQPIVVNGLVVAHRGQTVTGRVTEAKKAGRASGLSRLGLEVTEIGLADGDQVQVRTAMLERHGDTSYGRDAVGIGAAVGTGAAIGAGVNGGVGAGVGAAAGVVAGTLGVLLTRGRSTEVYPETPMTFRLESALTVPANYDAFRPASQQDYGAGMQQRPAPRPGYGPPARAYGYGYPPPPPVVYAPYPYYWGPSFYFGYGYGRGWRRW